MSSSLQGTQGVPISKDVAIELRQLVFGTASAPPRGEWVRTGFVFHPPSQHLSYGLRCQRNGTNGLLSVLQGYILKNLLFNKRSTTGKNSVDYLLQPNAQLQVDALLASMLEILMIIAEKSMIVIVMPSDQTYIPHSVTYFQDSVTEKLHLYEFRKSEDVLAFLRGNIAHFTDDPGPGTLLFLYSAVLTRSVAKVRTDLDSQRGSYLVGRLEEGSLNIITLLLTGRATPYLHNGVIYVGDEQNYATPQFGVLNRCSIGLLLWETDKNNFSGRQLGSRLKTPSLPIWITLCGTHYGVFFNTNPDLLRNYHAESRFDLHYYNCSGSHLVLTIDNRNHQEKASFMMQRQASTSSSSEIGGQPFQLREDGGTTPIERLIHTKWEEARIKFHSQPITLNYLFNAC